MNMLYPNFTSLDNEQKFSVILCPSTVEIAKCVSKYLGIMTNIRKEIDYGPDILKNYVEHKI